MPIIINKIDDTLLIRIVIVRTMNGRFLGCHFQEKRLELRSQFAATTASLGHVSQKIEVNSILIAGHILNTAVILILYV